MADQDFTIPISIAPVPLLYANIGPLSIMATYLQQETPGFYGPAVHIYAGPYAYPRKDENLRVDVFAKNPHYHIDPLIHGAGPSSNPIKRGDQYIHGREAMEFVLHELTLSELLGQSVRPELGEWLQVKQRQDRVNGLILAYFDTVDDAVLRVEQ